VELEDEEFGCGWRKLIIAARKATGDEDLLASDCSDFEAWQFEIEQLEGRILWDNDFETNELAMDLPPEQAEPFRELMGIPEDYALTVPDDFTPKQMEATIAKIREVCFPLIDQPD